MALLWGLGWLSDWGASHSQAVSRLLENEWGAQGLLLRVESCTLQIHMWKP